MKVQNSLLNYQNLKIIQNSEMFKFSLDSILLPNFITINKNIKTILDIGCGNAPIPLILSTMTKAKIIGVEIQTEVAKLGKESIKINHLEDQITIINDDINTLSNKWSTNTFDIITCNPPFFKIYKNSNLNQNLYLTKARHEINLTLEQLVKISSKLLKNKGILGIVHRPERLIEIIMLLKKYNLEPKKIQFVYPKIEKESNMILVEAVKNGNGGLKIKKPLIVHKSNGEYTDEMKNYFERKK